MSSSRITPTAVAVVIDTPAWAPERLTVKLAFSSAKVSPATSTVTVWAAWAAENTTCPAGSCPPIKSAPLAAVIEATPPPVTAQSAPAVPAVSPVRVTVKVNAVLPLLPSAFSALTGAIASAPVPRVSSFQIRAVARTVPIVTPAGGPDRVTVKLSIGSTTPSPATATVTTLLVSPGARLTVPEGSAPPTKSVPLTAPVLPMLPGVTVQFALAGPVVPPLRVTTKVKSVVPLCGTCQRL